MSRSRARLAADWFAKLRQNAVTQEVEHTDVVAAEVEALEAKADAAAVGIIVGPTGSQGPAGANGAAGATGLTGPQGPAGSADTAAQVLAKLVTVDGAGSGLDADKLDGYQSADTSAASTVVRRDSSGDINARLFRSEYDSTNAGCQYFMTQVDTASNNYLRPSTLAQVRAAVGKGYTAGSVGSYAWAAPLNSSVVWNSTRAGSSLRPGGFAHVAYKDAAAAANKYDAAVLSGTWRAMGQAKTTGSNRWMATLWLRIS